MGNKIDHLKGRVEEALGGLTRNADLKRKGRNDRLAGDAKQNLGIATDKVEEVIDKVKDVAQPR